MGYQAGGCEHHPQKTIFYVTPSLEGWTAKAKEAPYPHELRLASLNTNPVF